ncbi:MAG: Nif11-like leader peptide family RiPP precursor [Spirochaetia bacterium]|nr:Nif11-like leader peptide family RiPP precursor [Spirochaetia bacterium]
MPIDKTKITKEMVEKAAKCETAEELIALAKTEGFEITKDEAEAYFAELADVELNEKALRNIAGGTCTLEGTSCWTLSN